MFRDWARLGAVGTLGTGGGGRCWDGHGPPAVIQAFSYLDLEYVESLLSSFPFLQLEEILFRIL